MMVFVTGGASCGKSAFAEQLCTQLGGDLVYLAAMRPFGEEGARRVRKHRAQRAGKGFTTVECYEGLDQVLESGRLAGATALLECLGNIVANELFGDGGSQGDVRSGCEVADSLEGAIAELGRMSAHLVIVGNDVGCDGEAYPHETRVYQEALGDLSCRLAARSDAVIECVAGVPTVLKLVSNQTSEGKAIESLSRGEIGRVVEMRERRAT